MSAQSIITTDQNSGCGIRRLQQLDHLRPAYYLRLAKQVPARISRGRNLHHPELWILYVGTAQNGKMPKISCSANG
jgi:hypothetical protein